MTELHLTPEQEAEAQALFQRLKAAFEREAVQLARVMASKEDHQLLGGTEVEVRDQVHRLGAQVFEAVLQERKKKGTRGRRPPVPPATRPPVASQIATRVS
jgi:cell envelope opacity-associated protein A